MSDQLQGKKIAILVANEGVEQVELTSPLGRPAGRRAEVDLLAPEGEEIQAFNHLDKGDTFYARQAVGEADPADYDGLVLPGGVANPDQLRTDPDAVEFVRSFFEAGKPVGVICHGPWTLIEADVVAAARSPRGRACRPTCATPAPSGSTRRSTSTRAWSPAANPTISTPSTPRSSRSSPRACTRASARRPGRCMADPTG